jgi:hypothetical protein
MASAWVGGHLVTIMSKGTEIQLKMPFAKSEEKTNVWTIKPILMGYIFIPASVGQVLLGFFARSLYGMSLMDYYPIHF